MFAQERGHGLCPTGGEQEPVPIRRRRIAQRQDINNGILGNGSLPLATWGSRRLSGVKQIQLRLGFGQKALQKWGIIK